MKTRGSLGKSLCAAALAASGLVAATANAEHADRTSDYRRRSDAARIIAGKNNAAMETVGGLTWVYAVRNGKAVVGVETSSFQAIPIDTKGAVTIPSTLGKYSVAKIGKDAFRDCSGLTEVRIPPSVTSIGSEAFEGCSGLMSVTIPSGVTSIGDGVFEGCSGLMAVTIPAGVTSIGKWAFRGCSGLKVVTIPPGVTSIGDGAFEDCKGLKAVIIPPGVTSIGSEAFEGCKGLTAVTIPSGVTSIGPGAFKRCSGLKAVIFEGKPPKEVKGALIEKNVLIRYPARHEGEWLPVLEEGGFSKREAVK